MMRKLNCLFGLCMLLSVPVLAQEDLLKGLDADQKKNKVSGAFKSSRVINGHWVQVF